jgi:hypothetical protein
VQLGVTPNTSIVGTLVAMILARVPLALFARYRSIHVQNLAQSAISAATSHPADAGGCGPIDAARRHRVRAAMAVEKPPHAW